MQNSHAACKGVRSLPATPMNRALIPCKPEEGSYIVSFGRSPRCMMIGSTPSLTLVYDCEIMLCSLNHSGSWVKKDGTIALQAIVYQ
eukprot:18309-Chlamydomonas_euryale.AAC.1